MATRLNVLENKVYCLNQDLEEEKRKLWNTENAIVFYGKKIAEMKNEDDLKENKRELVNAQRAIVFCERDIADLEEQLCLLKCKLDREQMKEGYESPNKDCGFPLGGW